MAIPFDYIPYPPYHPDPRFRPMVKVSFIKDNRKFPTDALVDSGSDITLSFVEIGESLGINFKSPNTKKNVELMGFEFESEFFGLGKDPIKVYTCPISILMHDRKEIIVVRWICHKMDSNTDFPVVLGQDSLFMCFVAQLFRFLPLQSLFLVR
ncbi:hypothetical protein HYV82_00960 [Candidatus Woesearchaeota archaeon]|nr:hypothetical protein [Candidatus Woesearchaeota archaeon]